MEISIGVDSKQVKTGLDALQDQFRQARGTINTALENIKGFADIKKQAEETSKAYAAVQQRVAELAKTIKASGGGEDLARSFDQAKAAAANLKTELASASAVYAESRKRVAELAQSFKGGDKSVAEDLKAARQESRAMKEDLDRLRASYKEAKGQAAEFGKQVKGVAGVAREFDLAKREAAALKDKLADQRQEAQRLRTALGNAGIASTDVGKAQAKLRQDLERTKEKYQALAKVANARETLGLGAHADIQAQIAKTRQAYVDLATSGKASFRELAQAKVAMGTKIAELRSQTNGWKESLLAAKSELIQAGVAGAALVNAAKVGIQFETSMANVKKTVGGTKEEIRGLGNEIREMSTKIPMSADELAKIAAAGGQLGIASKDIGAFTSLTAKMATAFDMTAEAAGDSIGKIKNVYNLAIPEVEGLGNAINQLGNNSAAKEKDIVDVMLRVGGTANQFGLAKEATAALAATMLSLGKPAEVSGTSINALLNNMQTATMGSKDFKEALGKIGMSAEEMAAMVAKDPQKALDHLLNTLSKLEGQKRAEVLTGLFGKEFQDDIGVLVGGLQTYRDAMGQVADKTKYAGAINKEFANKTDTTESQLQLLKNTVVDIARTIGDGLLPMISAAAGWFNSLLVPVADLIREFPKISAALATVATGFLIFNSAKRLVDILRMAISAIGPTSVTSFATAGTAATGFGGKLTTLTTKAGGLSGVLGKASAILMAFGVGWEIGDILNNFDIVRKGGATLAYSLDRVWLAAKKMWRMLTGGDTGEVDREIEIARTAYQELLNDIDKKQDDWSKKQRGEIPVGGETEKSKEETSTSPAPAPKKEIKEIDGISVNDLKKMEGWDENKLTEKEKTAVAKYRGLGLRETPPSPPQHEPPKDATAPSSTEKSTEPNPDEKKPISREQEAIDSRPAKLLTDEQLKERKERLGTELSTDEIALKTKEEERKEKKAAEKEERPVEVSTELPRRSVRVERRQRRAEAIERRGEDEREARPRSSKRKQRREYWKEQEEKRFLTDDEKALRAEEEQRFREEEDSEKKDKRKKRRGGGIDVSASMTDEEWASLSKEQKEQLAKKASESRISFKDYFNAGKQEKRFRNETDIQPELARQGKAMLELNRIQADQAKIIEDKVITAEERKAKKAEETAAKEKQEAERQSELAEISKKNDEERTAAAVKAEEEAMAANRARTELAKRSAEERAQAEVAAAEKSKSVFQQYFDKVRQLQNEIAGREKSLAEELDGLDTTTPAEIKWKRQAKAAKDYEQAARKAMAAGNLGQALTLADQAKALFSGLKDGPSGISDNVARMTTARGVKSSGLLGLDISKMLQANAAKSAQGAITDRLFGNSTAVVRSHLAAMAGSGNRGGGSSQGQVAKVYEIRHKGGSLRAVGSQSDVESFLEQLVQAGLSAT